MEHEILSSALQPSADCPSLDELGRFADGALTPAERARRAPHIERCHACQAELAMLQAFADAEIRADEQAAVRDIVTELRRREHEIFGAAAVPEIRQRSWLQLVSVRHALSLATVLLLMVGSFYFLKSTPPRLPSDISPGGDVTRSLTVALRGPVGDQVEAPRRLEWQPVAGAVRYRARVMEVDRRELWSIDTGSTAADLPPAVRAQIVPAKTLLWQVTAYDASNATLAESRLERFRLARP
jgi:hypothetical protein